MMPLMSSASTEYLVLSPISCLCLSTLQFLLFMMFFVATMQQSSPTVKLVRISMMSLEIYINICICPHSFLKLEQVLAKLTRWRDEFTMLLTKVFLSSVIESSSIVCCHVKTTYLFEIPFERCYN